MYKISSTITNVKALFDNQFVISKLSVKLSSSKEYMTQLWLFASVGKKGIIGKL
jgi:hypothetical protein